MTQKIYRTKKYAIIGACASFLWLCLTVMLLNHETFSQLPIVVKLEGTLNISLLIMMVVFIRCFILFIKMRPLLVAGEKGLYLQVSKKNRGIVPWRHITHFDCSQDRRQVRVYLQGVWDIPDSCNEKFDIQIDENRQRIIVLPLYRKVCDLERVCNELEKWKLSYSDSEVSSLPKMDELSRRRIASVKKHGAASILIPLYFIRSKLWILTIIGFLILAALLEKWTAFSRPVVLAAAMIPALLMSFITHRLLSKAISTLEYKKEKDQDKAIGL